MRILMPSWYVNIFDRYLPEMKSIFERVEEFHVVYVNGKPKHEWERYFSFDKVDIPYGFVRSKVVRFFLSRRNLYNQVKDAGVDVLYTLSELWGQEFCRYCSSKMGVPYVVRLRGDHRAVRKAMRTNMIKEKISNYLDTRSLKQANLVIPISKALAKKAAEWGIDEEKIAPPVWSGVDTSMFKPMRVDRSSDFTVAYAGRLSLEKGVSRLIRIAEKLPYVRFIIAGKKEVPVSFPNNVEYLGELPLSEMPAFYNKADLIVLPSITEGFPSVILEAYACGKPVLATSEAFPEELKVFGSVTDINEFESEINDLKGSDLKSVSRGARSYVKKHYTWERFSQSVIELLKPVVE